MSKTNNLRFGTIVLFTLVVLSSLGCKQEDGRTTITLWHQMTVGEREVLDDRIQDFENENPDLRVKAVYKETEALRSGFQAAALAGIGPELIYGPNDPIGTFVAMGIVQDMGPWFPSERQSDFLPKALTFLSFPGESEDKLVQIGDRVGNHLALVVNRNLIERVPETTDELIEFAIAATKKLPKGRQYGLVWNFVEPFFFIPFMTGHNGWVFDGDTNEPALDSQGVKDSLQFVYDLQTKYKVLPANCDQETADSLFKDGLAGMIINGDWSWSQYLDNDKIDAIVAPLPVVVSTGSPMGPMVATKGYSLNAHTKKERAAAAMRFVDFMTSQESQRESTRRIKTLPSRKSLLSDPILTEDPTLLASAKQMENGKMTPVVSEMRAIWDAMRPPYQELLSGNISAEQAAQQMQINAEKNIAIMNVEAKATFLGTVLQGVGLAFVLGLLFWYRQSWKQLMVDLRKQPMAYLLISPALIVIALTIVYPFVYNIVLSFSNMSLRNFQDWQVTGFQNYVQVFSEEKFFIVLLKTIIWTVVCVFFHVAIGLLLASCLNGPVRGKGVYRIILILPWAVPAYITALTWRGMFNLDYGAINLMLMQWIGFSRGVNWLGDDVLAFVACIITNIWLGFPFMMVIALGGMQGIPVEMYEAARIDRVSRWKQFWHITVPMLKPVLVPAITLGMIWTFNNLNVVWLVTNAGEPADKTHILVSYVYKSVFNLYQYGYGAALSMIIFLMLLVFSLLFLNKTNATERVD